VIYAKRALTVEQQADQLIARGLVADRSELIGRLTSVNYYLFGVKPSVPGKNKNPKWHNTPGFANDRVGLMLTVYHFWLGQVSPSTKWKARLFDLFNEYPEIPLAEMGIPPNWHTHPLWV